MKTMRSIFRVPAVRRWICAGVSLAWMALTVSAATPAPAAGLAKGAATNAAPVEVPIPKSVFVDQIKFGKDPFFPNSLRRNPKPPPPPKQPEGVPAPGKPAPPPPPPPEPPKASTYLSLKAIFGSKTKPLAVLNTTVKNYDFFKGDGMAVKIPDFPNKENQKQIRVQVLDIKEDSITVKVDDGAKTETLELKLGKRP